MRIVRVSFFIFMRLGLSILFVDIFLLVNEFSMMLELQVLGFAVSRWRSDDYRLTKSFRRRKLYCFVFVVVEFLGVVSKNLLKRSQTHKEVPGSLVHVQKVYNHPQKCTHII